MTGWKKFRDDWGLSAGRLSAEATWTSYQREEVVSTWMLALTCWPTVVKAANSDVAQVLESLKLAQYNSSSWI